MVSSNLLFKRNSFFRAVFGGAEVKASAWNVGDLGLIPRSGRSPGEGNGNPLQYACLEKPMEGAAWWATIHGVAKSRTRLSDFTSLIWFTAKLSRSYTDFSNIPCPHTCITFPTIIISHHVVRIHLLQSVDLHWHITMQSPFTLGFILGGIHLCGIHLWQKCGDTYPLYL